MNRLFSCVAAIALATAVVAVAAVPAMAQNSGADARWQAWLGCWRPAGTLIRVVGKTEPSIVCVVPASSPSAVDVMTVSGGKVVDSTHVDADGQPHAISKDGCTGWQSAKWAPSARRVYIKSEFNCKGAATTHVSAVYAMAGSGEWIDVQGMRVEKNSGVHAVRYRQADDDAAIPAQIARKLHEPTLAKMTAMLAATEAPSITDVEEASRELDANVVSTWLIEENKVMVERPEPLNGKELAQMADRGVPASVIDVMVALSYPDVLAVNPAGVVARQNTDSEYSQYGYFGSMADVDPIIGFDRFGFPIYASQSAFAGGCSPWMYGPYDGAWNLYSSQFGCGYGYGAFPGYGYGAYSNFGYYGRGYFGGGPVVVPVAPGGGSGAMPSHGRVVNGRGYTQGGNDSGGAAIPRSNNTGSSASGSGGFSAPPPPPARTAVPKKP